MRQRHRARSGEEPWRQLTLRERNLQTGQGDRPCRRAIARLLLDSGQEFPSTGQHLTPVGDLRSSAAQQLTEPATEFSESGSAGAAVRLLRSRHRARVALILDMFFSSQQY